MGLLTIGAFARASRLSPKALRLYDELGLLRPASVDPVSGYRLYDPDQLEQARLVAWLRRIGMPLARIRTVCGLPPAAAATEVAAYWDQVEADTGARRELAVFLVDELRRKDTAMTATLALRYAVCSDRGQVRESNQDRAYAGARLLAVADGFGPHPAAEPGAASDAALASAVAIDALRHLDTTSGAAPAAPAAGVPDEADVGPGAVLGALQDAVRDAGAAVRELVSGDPALAGGGTTLTAMLWAGSRLALVHVGDSRGYLLRDGGLFQITHDHTMVQSLVDEGRLTADEAASHPERALLVRALHGGDDVEPDVQLREVRAGDRYLLCSDGLHSVVPAARLREVLTTEAAPDAAVRRLVELANEGGGPDNVTCVVADVIPAADHQNTDTAAGAAAAGAATDPGTGTDTGGGTGAGADRGSDADA